MQQLQTSFKPSLVSSVNPQYETIEKAILFLAGRCDGAATQDGVGFNGTDTEFGHSLADHLSSGKHFSHRQAYLALKMCRKYWRQLRKVGIELPKEKEFEEVLTAEPIDSSSWLVKNLSKGSQYNVELDDFGTGAARCDCEGFKFGVWCDHVSLVDSELERLKNKKIMTAPVVMTAPKTPEYCPGITEKPHLEPIVQIRMAIHPSNSSRKNDSEVEEVEEGKGRSIASVNPREEVLPGVVLNDGQWQALEEIEAFLGDPDKRTHLLVGHAGAGKTTLLQAAVKRMRDRGDYRKIVLTAPTNKAVKVLQKMALSWNLQIECMTIYKLLGLRPRIDQKTGKQTFVKDPNEPNKIKDFHLVKIDESSMLDSEIFEILINEISQLTNKTQVLFVGDDAQLPPIGERIARPFVDISDRSTLSEVMRYGGSIALLAEQIRLTKKIPEVKTEIDASGNGIYALSCERWHLDMLKAFESPKYRANPNFCKVLSYRNDRVDELNNMIRRVLYGSNAPQFVTGERVRMKDAFCAPSGLVLIQNTEECEIIEVQSGRVGDYDVWHLALRHDNGVQMVPVLKPESLIEFEKIQKDLEKRQQWHRIFDRRKEFAWIVYNYAATVHSSQGSTYQNCFVDVPNILKCRKPYERSALLYVACTRPSHRLLLMQT